MIERLDLSSKLKSESKKAEAKRFMKTMLIAIIVSLLAGIAAAQSEPAKKAADGPTKVTGDPIKTASGLEYWDIKVGTGAEAKPGHKVKVDYTGWLTNGKKFDSSVGKRPFEFMLGASQVIKGWDEGVAGMKVGGKRQLKIPAELGYGKRGAGGVIPPDAALIFDVQLLSVD